MQLKVENEEILQLVEMVNLSEMSSIKTSVSAIIRTINDPGATVKELKEVIQLDPPLTAKVLKTANSAYYSRSFTKTFADIEQAIIWMGSEIIRELALNQKVCEVFDKDEKIGDYSRKALWAHSVAVAMMCKMMYRKEFGLKGENIYVAGLLHDIGIIAEDQFLYNDYKEIIQLSKEKNLELSRAENAILGYDHARVGKAICHSWGLPEELVITVGYHTKPLAVDKNYCRMVATLYVADFFCQQNGFTFGATPPKDTLLLHKCLKLINVKPVALEMIFKDVKEEFVQMSDKGLI
ncbi:MAG: HDOD domain-containing protein [bacterium]|nr:HDOD domain-containing protein [bacterium]